MSTTNTCTPIPAPTGYRLYNLRKDIVKASEALGAVRLRDRHGHPQWFIPPASPLDGLRLLDHFERGFNRGLRDSTRTRLIEQAMSVARLGRCEDCGEVVPLAALGEGGLCRACATVAAS